MRHSRLLGVDGLFMMACAGVIGACGLAVDAHGQFTAALVAQNTTANPIVRPVGIYAPPGDFSRIFMVEKIGRVRIIDMTTNPNPTVQDAATPFLAITPTGGTTDSDERGLLGLAFHPQYMTNGRLYIYITQTSGTALVTRIYEYIARNPTTLAPTPLASQVDSTSARVIMQFSQPATNHNGGWIGFGPDGNLYIASGDGGGAGDTWGAAGNGQNRGTFLGKILRINVDNVGATTSSVVSGNPALYRIPADNPFAAGSGTLQEIWALGVRNPWRCSFDRLTGDFWIADVGQDVLEEINFQPAITPQNIASVRGRDYGWRCFEGSLAFNATGPTCGGDWNTNGRTGPVGEYLHAGVGTPPAQRLISSITGCSITGGAVYRGCAIPSLQGQYLWTDYCHGRIFRSTLNANRDALINTTELPQVWTGASLTTPSLPSFTRPTTALAAFGEDAYGEMYIIDQVSDRIFKLVPTTTGSIPLSNTDFNRDGITTLDDIFTFLNTWFAATPFADFNRDTTVNLDDIVLYLQNWFRGSCPFG